jgi:hypothetical protein
LQYSNPKLVEKNNKIFFSKDITGGSAAVNRPFKLISGEGDQELKGASFLEKYSDKKGYTTNVTGDLTPDNPYFAAGKQVTVLDKTGKVVAVYAMQGNNEEMAQDGYKHEFYKSKYTPEGQNTISIPVRQKDGTVANSEYIVDYEALTGNTLYEEGRPKKTGSRARLLDKEGNVVVDWVADAEDGSSSIDVLYNSLTKK